MPSHARQSAGDQPTDTGSLPEGAGTRKALTGDLSGSTVAPWSTATDLDASMRATRRAPGALRPREPAGDGSPA